PGLKLFQGRRHAPAVTNSRRTNGQRWATADLLAFLDSNGDGKADYSVITVISQQGAAGAHDEDLLGTITVYGNLVKASDITVDAMSVYGAYEKVGELPAGVHYELEDDGVLPNGATDGG